MWICACVCRASSMCRQIRRAVERVVNRGRTGTGLCKARSACSHIGSIYAVVFTRCIPPYRYATNINASLHFLRLCLSLMTLFDLVQLAIGHNILCEPYRFFARNLPPFQVSRAEPLEPDVLTLVVLVFAPSLFCAATWVASVSIASALSSSPPGCFVDAKLLRLASLAASRARRCSSTTLLSLRLTARKRILVDDRILLAIVLVL